MIEIQSSHTGATDSESHLINDHAFSRATGVPSVPGNSVRLLKDAGENFPAMLRAIREASEVIHFECYFFSDDEVGNEFAEALAAKAGEGLRVRVLYDWYGALGFASRRFWRRLMSAGVDVRCFNRPRIDSPFGWISRDHRKMLTVDGQVGFVFGLCIDQRWRGDPEKGTAPWRDTGIEIHGPAVADLDHSFSKIWSVTGRPLPDVELPDRTDIKPAGDVSLRVIAGVPHNAGLYRLDQIIALGVRRSLWITDSYFVGTIPYMQSLASAAMDGVDVRLLFPRYSDVPLTRSLTKSDYRPLLEAGVRIFEWNGSMLHAKTAVADGCWARVGSTNLNLVSWIENWELDVAVEDEAFAKAMERMYEDDLTNATEVTLSGLEGRRPGRRRGPRPVSSRLFRTFRIMGLGLLGESGLKPSEVTIMAGASLALLVLLVLIALWPWIVAGPVIAVGGWIAIALLIRSYRLYASRKREARETRSSDASSTSIADLPSRSEDG